MIEQTARVVLASPYLFDCVIVALFICAAVRWSFSGDWAKAMYWTGAVILNIAVLFMGAK
jgi:hypothetical protein